MADPTGPPGQRNSDLFSTPPQQKRSSKKLNGKEYTYESGSTSPRLTDRILDLMRTSPRERDKKEHKEKLLEDK